MRPEPRDPLGGAPRPDLGAGPARRVLVVEDNEVNAMILAAMLRRGGWEPVAAADGLAGIEMSARLHPRLILMDLQMPRLDGFAAARDILRASAREACPPPAIVAITAAPGPEARASCLAAGFADLLPKPVEMSDLLALVRRHMEGE
ncbi:response regulator [Amaricoccus solimangrovi]|uniref:Response regulator n=1 Tax=Amaricoccus solimangrovi TaxID=2589815 RepID=A0A501WNT7_9RHOB|nr:response regulator [Amaricoccus solimangrovi]TPE51403.1 response regulator [Amaricoccus solimangrovi]